jgi:hypothetical protein
MTRGWAVILYAVVSTAVFLTVRYTGTQAVAERGRGENYAEECTNEGCEDEEVNELYATYREECLNEGCDIEEVAEVAGGHNAVNGMLDAFQRRGFQISACTYNPLRPPAGLNNPGTGDGSFIGGWCNQPAVDDMWHDFDFDKENWDDGYGYDAACDLNLPLARTFNALGLLGLFGQSKPDDSPNWLPWFYAYASNEIDELDGLCGKGTMTGTLATTTWGPFIDNKTELYWGYFYGQDAPSRAGSIVHEARHAAWWNSHNGDSCAINPSCDENWGTWRANTLEVMYLWWLRAQGNGATTQLRELARDRANGILATGFDSRPTNADVFGGGTPSPGSPFSVP